MARTQPFGKAAKIISSFLILSLLFSIGYCITRMVNARRNCPRAQNTAR